jgi:hypothetical protein
MMSHVEEYWERGAGARASGTGPLHHDLGCWGFELLDALTLSERVISENLPPGRDNLLYQLPEHGMYRSARRTLNPAGDDALGMLTQPGLARHLADQEGRIENLLVELGANNALGTCATLQIRRSAAADLHRLAHERRCNLWEPDHFATLLAMLCNELESVPAERVFLCTVPHVTIAPLTRGVSPEAKRRGLPEREDGYYEYYTRFWIWDHHFDPVRNGRLTRTEARQIDLTIDEYNRAIREQADRRGWIVIDLCNVLDRLAFRRNNGQPSYPLPAGLVEALERNPRTSFRVRPDGEVLYDTRFMRLPAEVPASNASSAVWRDAYRGGVFGLDGVHPSTTGYGIVAYEVLAAMKLASVPGADPQNLDWHRIVLNDNLLTVPPALLASLEKTLDFLFAKLPLDKLIERLTGHGIEPL